MPDRTCSMDGCDKPAKYVATGWCVKHYTRWLRHGDAGWVPKTEPAPGTNTLLNEQGYVLATPPRDHPLRRGYGMKLQHRFVLFDKIGYGPHWCHWCGCPINWLAGLYTDHVDAVKTNNAPSNLVESCTTCNTRRVHEDGCRNGHPWTPETTLFSTQGRRMCSICQEAYWKRRNALRRQGRAEAKR